ncbi:MAG: hypothetical protein H6R10_2706 [Rhodocyclaceae bacterium]|nr:hypothetical protein [Rhodocyclaceae bacterium]
MSHRFAIAGLRAGGTVLLAGCLLAASPFASAALGSVSSAPAGQAVTLEGVLQVEVADFPDRSSITYHFLKTASGQRHALKFKGGRPPHFLSGTRVRVRGNLAGNVLTTEASPVPVGPAPADGAAALPYAAGNQKTAVILVNFQDKVTSPQTPSAVHSLVFGSVNSFYLENSFQTTSLSGNVFGWYTIPFSSTVCDIYSIANYARQAATGAGADLSPYARFLYIFPNTSACGWAGYGMIGGSPTDAWINGYFDRRIIAHEIGHNLGLYHAHSQDCGASVIGGSCTTTEYGDLIDTMGWGLYGHFSAFEKEYLGWLGYGAMPPIATAESSGTYDLVPYAGGSSGFRALKILKGTDAVSGQKVWYYLEYRQAVGFDNVLAGTGNLTSGVTVRTGGAANGSYLLDMTPGSDRTSEYNDLKDAALTVGRSFTDTAAGFSATVTRADSTGATVQVDKGGTGTSSCVRAKPSVALSPSQSSGVAAGTAVSFNLAVANNDGAACGSSAFSLDKSLPSGWSGSLGAPSLTIGAGGAASTTLSLTSPAAAAAGSYSFGASATSAVSALSGSAAATYVVAAGPSGPLTETVTTSQRAYRQGDPVTGTATVKQGGVPVADAAVAFKLTKANGYLVHQTAATDAKGQAAFRYTLAAADPVGAYRLGATAASGGASSYTSTSFTVSSGATLTETVAASQYIYTRGSTATTTATVKSNGSPVPGASVTFKMTKSNGDLLYYTTTTGSTGQAVYQYQISQTDPTGYYRSAATATSGGMTAYTSTSFQVR